jgi:hypothetical protein
MGLRPLESVLTVPRARGLDLFPRTAPTVLALFLLALPPCGFILPPVLALGHHLRHRADAGAADVGGVEPGSLGQLDDRLLGGDEPFVAGHAHVRFLPRGGARAGRGDVRRARHR